MQLLALKFQVLKINKLEDRSCLPELRKSVYLDSNKKGMLKVVQIAQSDFRVSCAKFC